VYKEVLHTPTLTLFVKTLFYFGAKNFPEGKSVNDLFRLRAGVQKVNV